jgi:aspartate kinase
MSRIVMKFGGTSVADLDRIRNVAARVGREVAAGHQVAVVVSAMAGETNKLVKFCTDLAPLHDAREYDAVVATGENVTAGLLAIALQQAGVNARSWQGWQAPIRTDGAHGKARIDSIDGRLMAERMAQGQVPVVAGFQGLGPDNRVTTLGRGGSDTSAVAVAAAVQADRCDIYTDVDGVYTTDPRMVPRARKLAKISYEEMLEMASLGAKVLQTRSVGLAMKERVRVQVLSSFDERIGSELPGTLVVDEDEIVEKEVVSGIAYARDEVKITVRAVPDRPGRGQRERRHDRAERERGRHHRHHLHAGPRRPGARHQGAGGPERRDRLRRPADRHGGGQDQRGRHRHDQPCRRGADHVQDAG